MKYPALLLASLAFIVSSPSLGPTVLASPVSLVAPAPFDVTADFLKAMRKAMSIGANEEIVKLVRKNQQGATFAALELCQANSRNPSEKLEGEINALRIAWNKSMKTGFVEKIYEYYSFLDSTTRAERGKMVNRYLAFANQLAKAEADKNMDAILKLGADFRGVAEELETTGDHYYSSEAWLGYFTTQDERLRGEDANFDEAAIALKKVIDHREAIELKDANYEASVARFAVLTSQGYGPDAKAEGDGPDGAKAKVKGPAQAVGDPLLVPLKFQVETDIGGVIRPIWSNDEVYNAWVSIYFEKKGDQVKLGALEGAVLERTGPITFDLISGENRTQAEMNGKFVPVEVKLKGPNGDYPWAFLAIIGTRQDTFQGVTVNREPADNNLTVFVAPAAVLTGLVGETPIEVFDDTMSGKWGDEPRSWAYVGMSPDHYQWDIDSIRIDGAKRALPWSRIQQVGDSWYDMKIEGSQLTAQPVEVKTGKLKLKFKGPKPRFVIVRGDGELSENYYDLAAAKSIEVPIGKYELFAGALAKGKRDGVKKVVMLPGAETPLFKVEEGKEITVTLGGPFAFDFDYEDLGETVKIHGASVVVTGVAGERYERPWNARPHPEASLRKIGSKRGSKGQRMLSTLDQDLLYADWSLGFHPQDLELPKPKGGGKVEVQLVEKKNGLFGSLSSPWKGEKTDD